MLRHKNLCQERNKGMEKGENKIKRPRISKQLGTVRALFSAGSLWLCQVHAQKSVLT